MCSDKYGCEMDKNKVSSNFHNCEILRRGKLDEFLS